MVKEIQNRRIVEPPNRRTGKPYSGTEIPCINISRAVKEMAGRGLVYSKDSLYYMTDPLFEKYIKVKIMKE